MEPTTVPTLFNYAEAAKMLRVSEKTLRRYVKQEKINTRRIGRFVRFTPEDLNSFIDASAKAARP